jgi:hypothetical protein
MPNIGELYGQAQNLQLNRMRMEEARETAQERNALRGLLSSGVDINTPEGLSQLRRVAPTLSPQYEQAASQRAYQTAQVGRLRAQTEADALKVGRDLFAAATTPEQYGAARAYVAERFPQYASSIPAQFSVENARRIAEGAEGLLRRVTANAEGSRPNEFERALLGAGIRPGSPEWQEAMRGRATSLTGGRQPRLNVSIMDGRPVITDMDTGEFFFAREAPGGTQRNAAAPVDLRRPPAAAPAAPPAQPANMMLPNAAAPTLAAGPNAVPPAAAPTLAEVRAEQGQRAITQAGGEARAREAGTLEARSAATQRREQEQLTRAISELERITERGGLLERSTGGGLNAIVDRFFDFFNAPTSGAVAIGALQPIADVVTKMVPRFEGPQSNADTQSYREAAGRLADPTVPNETRLAAAREIIRLFRTRADQFETAPSANAAPTGGNQPAPTGTPSPARTGQPQTQTQTTFREGQIANGPNGQRIQFRNGQWVPMR